MEHLGEELELVASDGSEKRGFLRSEMITSVCGAWMTLWWSGICLFDILCVAYVLIP
jgi:hypothetical protein